MTSELNFVTPQVHIIAATGLMETDGNPVISQFMELAEDATSDSEHLVEFAGRSCYESYHRPNAATASNNAYLTSTLLDKYHYSISEHAVASLYITGVSRAMTHELIRHRHLSYSQLSQRFVDESTASFVMPPLFRGDDSLSATARQAFISNLENDVETYKLLVEEAIAKGATRKQAREAARAILPNAVETKIVVSGNMRAFKEVIDRRTAPDADAEIQEVAGLMKQALAIVFPVFFNNDTPEITEETTDDSEKVAE